MFLPLYFCHLLLWPVHTFGVLHEEIVASVETTAVLTGVARLPCNLQTTDPTDKVTLVIWYKDSTDSTNTPIYSLDARGHSLDQATHWADEHALGGRAFFRVTETDLPAGTHLAVENVRDMDAGSYRCRVDFQGSPTRNSVVNLTVIVPPRKLTILYENGTNVQQKRVIGPYTEGSTAQITCSAAGGRPAPRVTWWRDGIEIDNSDEALSEHRVKNILRLENLERRHLNTVLTCKASNNDMVSPLTANVTLDMHRVPGFLRWRTIKCNSLNVSPIICIEIKKLNWERLADSGNELYNVVSRAAY